jgi:prepilin-type N-terminal cleavage/methylation domain-containing protein
MCGICFMKSPKLGMKKNKRAAGFSLLELVVAMAVALLLIGIGMPSFLRAYHAYQLTNSASQLADILRLTRYEAIRLNKSVNCLIQPDPSSPGVTDAFADSDGNLSPSPTEKIVLLGNGGNIVDPGGVPGAGALLTKANLPAATLATPGTMSVQFDARGAVARGNVTVFYLASTLGPEAGYRAVVLLPAGSIQVWTGDGTGYWSQLR